MMLEGLKIEEAEELEDWIADACAWQDMLKESGAVDLGDELIDDWEMIQKLVPAGW